MTTNKHETMHSGENRAQDLILAAYRCIAERGFEGLRLREVADQVGLNHATLHHYFPTKEVLVQAVVLYVTERFAQTAISPEGTPREQLRSHLHRLQERMREEPDLFIALNEIQQRALRDPAIRVVTQQRTEAWHQFLVSVLKAGIAQGDWSEDLDAEAAASAIIALMNSVNIRLAPEMADQAVEQLERWLMMGR
jgi:AcrR family transcriptional regulator